MSLHSITRRKHSMPGHYELLLLTAITFVFVFPIATLLLILYVLKRQSRLRQSAELPELDAPETPSRDSDGLA